MTRKVMDRFMWKANVFHQTSGIEKANLDYSQTDDASGLDWQQAEGYTLSVVEG